MEYTQHSFMISRLEGKQLDYWFLYTLNILLPGKTLDEMLGNRSPSSNKQHLHAIPAVSSIIVTDTDINHPNVEVNPLVRFEAESQAKPGWRWYGPTEEIAICRYFIAVNGPQWSVPYLVDEDGNKIYPFAETDIGGVVMEAMMEQRKAPEGMPVSQEPKYGIKDNRLFNRETGEFIPDDEPVFIMRARDANAATGIVRYISRCMSHGHPDEAKREEHVLALMRRYDDFRAFAKAHPDRMKYPDTEMTNGTIATQPATEGL
jgi:hypothetical protein